MKYRIFSNSLNAWEAMLSAIRSANKSIYLEMYILDDDSKGSEFFNALENASKMGIKVVVILDIVGSYDIWSGAVNRLRETGAEVLFCSFFFKRLHRKVLIIDETIAFIGGVNVGKKYARWKDLQVQVTGTVVESMIQSFVLMYKKCGGKNKFAEVSPKQGPLKRAEMWFVDHGIGRHRQLFRKYYEERLDNAHTSIVLVTPYLFPPRWFIARLHQAMLRGVKVEILLPKFTDYTVINGINRSFATCLVGLGAKCYFADGMNHAKAMLVDNTEGIIGSQNLDMLSFDWNIEAGVFFHDEKMVHDLAQIINTWKAEAIAFNQKQSPFRWYDIPTAFFLRLFGLLPI
jgi:cardiolipin synthase A/B